MISIRQIREWLETHFCSPAYSGLLLAAIALCFFGAATNTMAGWLYAISGIIFALLVLGAILCVRSLIDLQIRRLPVAPVSAGDRLIVELEIRNLSSKPKALLQALDLLPFSFSEPQTVSIESIPPQGAYPWSYDFTVKKRGVYQWHEVQLLTGNPLGLFWCRRSWEAPAKAVVYPSVLPLSHCPLIDALGQEDSTRLSSDRRYQAATEGLTKALRPYRLGDPTRLIAWRASARFDQLQVRELETITGGQEVVICLDSTSGWQGEEFEQAVIAAASLYFYASRCKLNVGLWTAQTGIVRGDRAVLETLAEIFPNADEMASLPSSPLIWLTQKAATLASLRAGSRWVFFSNPSSGTQPDSLQHSGLVIDSEKPLQQQLQKPLTK